MDTEITETTGLIVLESEVTYSYDAKLKASQNLS